MTTRGLRVVAGLALTAIATLVAGCSHDTLDSGTESLAVSYLPNPSGTGRFERATFGIVSILFLPIDPAAASVYGTQKMSLRFDPFDADLTLTQAVAFSQVAIASGGYRVTEIRFTKPFFVDTDVSTTPVTCIDGVSTVPSGPAAAAVPTVTTFTNEAAFDFNVRPGQSKLSITINVPGFIAGVEAAFTCTPDCGAGQPCLTGFDQTTYENAFLANISIE